MLHIAAVRGAVGLRFAIHGHAHLAVQNNVRRFHEMRVLAIFHARAVFPDVQMRVTLTDQLFGEVFLFHGANLNAILNHKTNSSNRRLKTTSPSLQQWGSCSKGVPSSGEKIVNAQTIRPAEAAELPGKPVRQGRTSCCPCREDALAGRCSPTAL